MKTLSFIAEVIRFFCVALLCMIILALSALVSPHLWSALVALIIIGIIMYWYFKSATKRKRKEQS